MRDKIKQLQGLGYEVYDIHWILCYLDYGMKIFKPGSYQKREHEKRVKIADEKLKSLIENNNKEEIETAIQFGRGGITMFDLI